MEWLLVLFFGGSFSLTDNSIDLLATVNEIPLRRPIYAINSGASILIDITSMIPKDQMNINSSRKWISENIRSGCIKAMLKGDSTKDVYLEFKGGVSYRPERLRLILDGEEGGVPTRRNFNKLFLSSCIRLSNVDVYWMNYQK